jgi:cephalosporin hydroxylase
MTSTNIQFENEEKFIIDNISFVIDITAGNKRRVSEDSSFTIVKTKSFIEQYLSLSKEYDFKSVLELGIFQGGSYVFMDKLFKPDNFSAIDISREPIRPLMNYISQERDKGRGLYAHFGYSQTDVDLLNRVYKEELNSKLDLVVDDASHTYEFTKKCFEHLFPLVEPGGIYIIED